MENIQLPKIIEYKDLKENKAQIKIEPLFPGYGITIANPRRRVLISSLEGAAVTKIKIKGVNHEFSSIPFMKEDIVEFILNVKKIRMKIFSDEPLKLKLKKKGEGPITAGDIEKNAQLEVVNPNLILGNLTDKKAEFEMEFTAEKGMGYVTVEDRGEKESIEPGEILIDAIFSPIVNVSFTIEELRVGKMTDYEKVSMKIETDGSLSPKEAIQKSVQILLDHLTFIANDGLEEILKEKMSKLFLLTSPKQKILSCRNLKDLKVFL